MGHHFRLSASRIRPHLRPQHANSFQQVFTSSVHPRIPGQRRNFSGADVAHTLLRSSEWLITNVHQVTGTPWCVSFPLAALVVGICLRAPLTFYSHRMACKRAKLAPLIQAEMAMLGLGLRKKAVPDLRKRVASLMAERSRRLVRAVAGSERNSIIGGLVTLPVFVSNVEVIRRMCAGPLGLLGRLAFGRNTGDATHTGVPEESTEALPAAITSATDLGGAAASLPPDGGLHIPVEPTLATEGCLWFPNLLEADPLHILPFAVSAMLVANMIPDTVAARRELFGLAPVVGDKHAVLVGQSKKRRAFQRTMLILASAIGPLTMDLPAAIHLYWLSSATFSLAVSLTTKRAMPIPRNTIKPCRGMEIPLLLPKAT
ncbi:hypothetical protein N0V82_004162 [Gnomoniopsis sp. IMI 355080]|nr:hypothetical protein N0V82_004162 [Gnomoniopsis sp. IMI 355080]